MTLSKPEAIFFDWDGTLVDSFSFLEAAHNFVLEKFEMPLFEKGGFHIYFGKPREEIYYKIYGERGAEAQALFEIFVQENHKKNLNPMIGAEDLLQSIQAQGIVMGVVSNKKPEFVNAEIDHFGWRTYFRTVVGAREAESDKPSPAPLYLGVERAGLNVNAMDRFWYVGDTKMDLLCAHAAQSPFIYIDDGVNPIEYEECEKPHLIVKNCTELSDFLLQYA